MIYYLLIITIICFVFSYIILRDIFSPACLISISYIISVFLAILNINTWDINLSTTTVDIISVGLISFIVPSIIFTFLYKSPKRKRETIKPKNQIIQQKGILLDKCVIFFFVILELITTILYIYYMMENLGTGLNLANFSERIQSYRKLTMTDAEAIFDIPFYVKQLIKLSKAFIYCYSFVIIYNCALLKEKFSFKKHIPISFIISIIIYFVQTVFSASRFNLAILVVYLFLTYYVLFFARKGIGTVKFKTIIRVCLIIVVFGFLFFVTKEFFGRTSDKTFVEYLGAYFGGSIELLDLYVINPLQKSLIWGKETFTALNSDLFGYSSNIHLEFRQSNGIWIGNVYTAFRNYYQDFGMQGVIILQVIYSFIITNLYNIASKSRNNTALILYALFGYTLVLHSYRDFFFSTIISINYLNIMFYMFIVMQIFKRVKIKLR